MKHSEIQEMLVPGSTKVVVEAEEEIAVRVGNMNYQVQNGGWDQWWDNGYGPRDIDWLVDFFHTHREYKSFKWIFDLLEKVQYTSELPGTEECTWCGGSGEIEDEDPETGEVEYEECPECRGTGEVATDEPSFPDEYDDSYYAGNDKLMDDMELYLSGKGDEIETVSPETTPKEEPPAEEPPAEEPPAEEPPAEEPPAEEPPAEEPPAEEPSAEEPSAEKKRPRVKLVGTDGNAFAVLGTVTRALKKAGYSKEEVDEFRREAMGGDYNHLLATAMEWVDVY